MTVSCGDSIRFDIGFSGGSRDNLEFRHEGRLLTEGGGVRIQVEKEVASLIIEAATPEHSGLYECIMRTEGGEARCQVRCSVVESTSATTISCSQSTTVVESAQIIQNSAVVTTEKSEKK
jgi:hypothetical protein